jgi:DNA end-binding protein Ku
MRAIWNGFISFGLVTIPVAVGIAQQRRDVSFRTLSRATGRPVKQKRWDPERDVEVQPDDTVKGYEISKGTYLPVEEAELERFAAQQEKTIQILQFVDLEEVDPVYYEKAYWLEPKERAERPYRLLATAMERTGKAAVGRFVLSTKEHVVLIRALDGMLALQTLYYPEDVRMQEREEISGRLKDVQVREEELGMAEQLIGGLAKPFAPEEYPNETRHALLEFLEAKAAGQEPAAPAEAPEPTPVIDLMAALKASLGQVGGGAPAGGGEDAAADAGAAEEAGEGAGDGEGSAEAAGDAAEAAGGAARKAS